jgi:hypothetical protein
MMPWANLRRRPVQVEHTVAPADVVPPTPTEPDRTTETLRHIHRTLLLQSRLDPAARNTALVDFCLEVRSLLKPPSGSEVLREQPPALPQRHPSVPVIPERAS